MLAAAAMVVVALVTWSLVYLSGVHATIAGVALGLAMMRVPGMHLRHVLEPVTNGVILPLFAFSAALVAIPAVSVGELAPPFWAILIALPVGKLVGITVGGWLSGFVGRGSPGNSAPLAPSALLCAGALGGVGFTVSLLMNELAFADAPSIADEGTLAVLLGSAVSIVASAVLVANLAARHRRLSASMSKSPSPLEHR
jgi:NhaA family Na+:H+ antiporter